MIPVDPCDLLRRRARKAERDRERFEGFVQIGPPTDEDVAGIAVQVATRVVRMLRRRGKVEDDEVVPIEDDGSMLLP